MDDNIEEMRKRRFQFLLKVYEIVEGVESSYVNMYELGNDLNLTRAETKSIVEYLQGGGYIRRLTFGGDIKITHSGVVEVEQANTPQEQPASTPSPVNIINVEQMTNSQIQQGSVQSTQIMELSSNDLQSIAKFIEQFKNRRQELQLEKDAEKEADAEITTLETQLKSPKPKQPIIRECLATLRHIIENAAGQIAATLLMGQFPKL